jgi:TetR/AcrR family fatty acid metabolism transcriptional regulator
MPRQDVSEERKNQILDAASTVFARSGFAEARMDDIAAQSGLSKGALYLYYKSKDALISALLQRLFNLELRGVRGVIEGTGSVSDRLFAMTRLFAADLDRLSLVMPITLEFYAVAARQRSVRQFFSEMLRDYRAILTQVIEEGVASGEFRSDVAPGEVAFALIALYEGLLLLWIVDPHAVRWLEQAEASLRLILAGIRQPDAGGS